MIQSYCHKTITCDMHKVIKVAQCIVQASSEVDWLVTGIVPISLSLCTGKAEETFLALCRLAIGAPLQRHSGIGMKISDI